MNIILPRICFHCDEIAKTLLCEECTTYFQLIPKEGRCIKCFSSISMHTGVCKLCRQISHPFKKLAACFDSFGPAGSIALSYKNGYFRLEETIAASIVLQLHALSFPPFHIITSFSFPSLAKNVARRLNASFKPLIQKKIYPNTHYEMKKKCTVFLERVLLIELELKNRVEIRLEGTALNKSSPEYLYGIAFCGT